MLALQTELAHLPRSLVRAIWEALDTLNWLDSHIVKYDSAESPHLMHRR